MREPQFAQVRITSAELAGRRVVRSGNAFGDQDGSESLAAARIGPHNTPDALVNRPEACNAPQARTVGWLPALAGADKASGDGATT